MARILGLLLLLASFAMPRPFADAEAVASRLSSDELAATARAWLIERLGVSADQVSVELLSVPRDLVLPPGAPTTTVSFQSGSLTGGPVTLLVEATVLDSAGHRIARSTTITFRITGQQEVVVTARELPRRTVISAADLRIERRPTHRVPPSALRSLREAIGKELVRGLAPGEVVTAAFVTAPVVIRRGSAVTLRLEGRGFTIVARGIAAEDGARGQNIRVVNPASRREVTGTVENERTIRIPF
jgi:flagella basal body P-ring formation protein FlgA